MCQGLVDSDDVFIAEMLEIARRIIEAGHWRSVYNSSVEDSATHSVCNQLKLPTIKIQMFLQTTLHHYNMFLINTHPQKQKPETKPTPLQNRHKPPTST